MSNLITNDYFHPSKDKRNFPNALRQNTLFWLNTLFAMHQILEPSEQKKRSSNKNFTT